MPNPYQTLILSYSSLIHYWELDELSGSSAADSKGSLAGTIATGSARSPTLGVGGLPAGGTSFLFNGATGFHDSNVSVSAFSIGGVAGFTVEAWVYIPSSPASAQHVVAFSDSGAGSFSGRIHLQSDKTPQADVYDGTGHTINGNAPLSNTTWHHLVMVCPASGTMTLYVDGVAQTNTASLGTPYNLGNALAFWIGGGTAAWDDATFQIDEVAVYNDVLTPTQILNNYNTGMTTFSPVNYVGMSSLMPLTR
jgi:hypothetical protein